MSLALRLKALRTNSKKSLQDVADEVGASKAHVWDLETGKSKNPGIDLLTKLAACFKVSVSDIIGENPDGENQNPEIIAMYRDLQSLSDSDLETIRIMMERLKVRNDIESI